MPQGVAALQRLGLLSDLLSQGGVKFYGIRFQSRAGRCAQAHFPGGPEEPPFGLVMRRLELDAFLLERVRALPNVTVREGFRVTGVIQDRHAVRGVWGYSVARPEQRETLLAPLTIGADGRDSVFHRRCGLEKAHLRRKRFGITGHLEDVEGLEPYVEVLLHQRGEVYMAPCGPNTAAVALLLEERACSFFKGNLENRYLEFLHSLKALRHRLRQSKLLGPVVAVGPLGFTVTPCYRPGLLLVGDSSGFLDPLTGQGMTLALKDVEAAVPIVAKAFAANDFSDEMLAPYARERSRLKEDLVLLTCLLLNLSRLKCVGDRVIRRLHDRPEALQKLLGIVAGTVTYRELSLREKFALVVG